MSNAFKLSSLRQRDDDLFARSQNFAYVAHAFIALSFFPFPVRGPHYPLTNLWTSNEGLIAVSRATV